ncbi:hypothetical protein A3B32_00860 [Candidatus Uhrbacteria bacterium RIFCSPLOWO2_01_FULL_53_9]|uniref:Glycosyltransferase subfamily 4-like N-terminal domain-containing protein n=3 Tax=Candidatus Uhriibacteriota TaxID=1752732 RepID=A0A1F7UYC1_9BACT|nr:MAG: hypothetical protein A3C17_00335 [Candidatus Uhrbacteria bacterium RIFCSPHIGHO2_02_FULL_53_13]OGL83275.1 MAG: hypothetical protein A3B32_00860 [Candidatus Uhrbacteria bacterium RIFCSPLOWO2_01_FULL_53_9]OGL89635.1 MAG: hypothetical protein A3I45_04770 [Candidatus Uhrbacteria bacterium RIFCSPLOWO2_02_FULL_53_10]
MKILIINKYWYRRGGADRYAIWLADALVRRGHEVRVFSVEHSKNIPDHHPVCISNVQTEQLHLLDAPRTIGRMVWSLEAQRALRELLRAWRPDIAHVHNIYTQMSPSVLPVLHEAKIPVVAHVHDYGMLSANYSLFDAHGIDRVGSFWSVVRRRGVKDSYVASAIAASAFAFHKTLGVYEKNIDRLIFTARFVQDLFKFKGWHGDRGTVIPYVVDLKGEDKKPQEDNGKMVFAGRLHKTKGVEILIEAARKTGISVEIIGDGPDRQKLQRQAGAMTNVSFLGALDNEATLCHMREARAVVVPSVWWEPFGMVAIEPQGLGTPVIASRTGGLAELVVHGQTGFLVPPSDVSELALAMRRLHDDPKEAWRMGLLGKRRFETQFSIDEHMRKLMVVYAGAVDNGAWPRYTGGLSHDAFIFADSRGDV